MKAIRSQRRRSFASQPIEALEARSLLSGSVGVISIDGAKNSPNTITVNFDSSGVHAVVNGKASFHAYSAADTEIIQISGGSKNDVIHVNAKGYDDGETVKVLPTSGNDQVFIATATVDVVAYAGSGNDRLDAGFNHFYTNASDQNGVTLVGGSGNDTLIGSAGDDSLLAGSGSTIMYAGVGQDTMMGGSGPVDFYYEGPEDGGGVIDGGGNGYHRLFTPDGKLPNDVLVRKINVILKG